MVIKAAIANCPLNGGNEPTQDPHKVEHKVLGRRRHMRAKTSNEVAKDVRSLGPRPRTNPSGGSLSVSDVSYTGSDIRAG